MMGQPSISAAKTVGRNSLANSRPPIESPQTLATDTVFDQIGGEEAPAPYEPQNLVVDPPVDTSVFDAALAKDVTDSEDGEIESLWTL